MLAQTQAAGMVDPVTLSLIQWVQQQIQTKRDGYELFRRYYRGDHRTMLTDRLRKFLELGPSKDLRFRDNFCEVVVDSMAERLTVTGFDAGSEDLDKWLWDTWQTNRMDRAQAVVHTETLALGDGYVLIDWDNEAQRLRFHSQEAEMMIPHRNGSTGEMEWISKVWVQQQGHTPAQNAGTTTLMNLYFPDRIEKFRAQSGIWLRRSDEGETDWPVPWLDKSGAPLGLPLIHFRNASLSDDYGHSELSNAIPMQDVLNKLLIDLVMVADTAGFPQRYVVNIDTGKTELEIVPGSYMEFHTEPEQTFAVGQFDAADLEKMLSAIEMVVQHIAGITRTPQHLFHILGNYPSGEALKTAEAGLVAKIIERQVDFGNSWEDVMMVALRIQNAFGEAAPGASGDVILNTLWKDPQMRNEKDHIEALAIKREKLNVSQEQIWREAGYSQEDIDRIREELDTARERDNNIGAVLLGSFNRGGGGGGTQAVGAP